MTKAARIEVMGKIQECGVEFIHLWFTDVLGFLKTFVITTDELELAMTEGMGFDGSSIQGFARIQESDMIALPDPSTIQILPWRQGDHLVATMFCDITTPDGAPYPGDPREVLRRNIARAKEMGYDFFVGPELEYYYFKNDTDAELLDHGSYFDMTTRDLAIDLRKDTMRALKNVGIQVEYSHHEVGPSQHEIDLRYDEALRMADKVMAYRLVVKEVAQLNDAFASFMPKPIYGEAGSGMHVHQSLFKGDSNAFYDAGDEYHLSDTGKAYMAGLLYHARDICAVTNQWVNSYKRLSGGDEAPTYICWGHNNRSALVRVPMYKPLKEQSTRVEIRSPDSACNPYLAFAVLLAAGLKGIEEGYELPEETEDNVWTLTDGERRALGIDPLPTSLADAIAVMERSELVAETLGEHVFDFFLRNKRSEWQDYRRQVTAYERDRYLPVL